MRPLLLAVVALFVLVFVGTPAEVEATEVSPVQWVERAALEVDVSVPVLTPIPTPAPTPEPTPATLNEKEQLVALVHATFPDDPRMGDVVVWSESLTYDNWRDYVYNGVWSTTGDCGLMQVNWYWHGAKFAAHGWGMDDCFDPVKNLVIAREVYDSGGPYMWTTY